MANQSLGLNPMQPEFGRLRVGNVTHVGKIDMPGGQLAETDGNPGPVLHEVEQQPSMLKRFTERAGNYFEKVAEFLDADTGDLNIKLSPSQARRMGATATVLGVAVVGTLGASFFGRGPREVLAGIARADTGAATVSHIIDRPGFFDGAIEEAERIAQASTDPVEMEKARLMALDTDPIRITVREGEGPYQVAKRAEPGFFEGARSNNTQAEAATEIANQQIMKPYYDSLQPGQDIYMPRDAEGQNPND